MVIGCVLLVFNAIRVEAVENIDNQLLNHLPSRKHNVNESEKLKILIWSHPKLRNFIGPIGKCSESCTFTFDKQEINSSDAVALSSVFLTGDYP